MNSLVFPMLCLSHASFALASQNTPNESLRSELPRRELGDGSCAGLTCSACMKQNGENLVSKINLWKDQADAEVDHAMLTTATGLVSAAAGATGHPAGMAAAALIDLATDAQAAMLAKAHDNLSHLGKEIYKLQEGVGICFTEVANELSVMQIMDRTNDAMTREANLKEYLKYATDEDRGTRPEEWGIRKTELGRAMEQVSGIYTNAQAQWFATNDGTDNAGTLARPSTTDALVWRTAVQQAMATFATLHRNAMGITASLYTMLKKDSVSAGRETASIDEVAKPFRAHKTVDGDGNTEYETCNGILEQALCLFQQKDKLVEWTIAATNSVIAQAMQEYKDAAASFPEYEIQGKVSKISVKEEKFNTCAQECTAPVCEKCHQPQMGSFAGTIPRVYSRQLSINIAHISYYWKGRRGEIVANNHLDFDTTPTISTGTMKMEAAKDIRAEYRRHYDLPYASTCSTMSCSTYSSMASALGSDYRYTRRESTLEAFCSGESCSITDLHTCCDESCFPGSTVLTTIAGPKRADQIAAGDEVLVATPQGALTWDTIAMAVSHNNPAINRTFDYRLIHTSDARSLRLSPDHYLHARKPASNASCCGATTLTAAADVVVGDELWTTSASGGTTLSTVTGVKLVVEPSAYNFMLLQDPVGSSAHHGFHSIVTDGIIASSFTSSIRLLKSHGPNAADRLGDPVRALYRAGLRLQSSEVDGDTSRLFGAQPAPTTPPETIFSVAIGLQNIIADCVEAAMVGCSEPELQVKMDILLGQMQDRLPPEVVSAVMRAVEAAADAGMGVVARTARRLSSYVSRGWIQNHTAHVVREVTIIVRSEAGAICHEVPSCAANRTSLAMHHAGMAAMLGAILGALVVALTLLGVAILLLLRRRRYRASPTPTATKTGTKTVEVSDAQVYPAVQTPIKAVEGVEQAV